MYAIIETGGKQYKVEGGTVLYVEKLDGEADAIVDFKVVALATKGELKVGAPYLEDVKITGKILKSGKGKKMTIFTYKSKKSEKRKMGHRQPYTMVQVQEFA